VHSCAGARGAQVVGAVTQTFPYDLRGLNELGPDRTRGRELESDTCRHRPRRHLPPQGEVEARPSRHRARRLRSVADHVSMGCHWGEHGARAERNRGNTPESSPHERHPRATSKTGTPERARRCGAGPGCRCSCSRGERPSGCASGGPPRRFGREWRAGGFRGAPDTARAVRPGGAGSRAAERYARDAGCPIPNSPPLLTSSGGAVVA
jgi:hypothetical protein